MIRIILFCATSLAIGSSLNDWIENKSKLIRNNDFKVSFNYTVKDKKKKNQENMYQDIEYYSINQNNQVLKIDNRYILFHPDYSEVIDNLSKQKFLEKKDMDLEKMRDKLLSIFIDNDFKIIKLSDNKFLLSLNNYYLNINIIFDSKSNLISEFSFTVSSVGLNVAVPVVDPAAIVMSDTAA